MTTIFLGLKDAESASRRPLGDVGLDVRIDLRDYGPWADLVVIAPDAPARLCGDDAPTVDVPGTFATCISAIVDLVTTALGPDTTIDVIGAVRATGANVPTTFVGVERDQDQLLSRSYRQPRSWERDLDHNTWSRWLLDCEPHGFIEADINERTEEDLDIIEREIKLDADVDPRAAAWGLQFGDGDDVVSGTSIPDLHFHRVHDVGESGLFDMTSDPNSGSQLLKYKHEIGAFDEEVYRRFEIVEPATAANFRRIIGELDPEVDPDQVVCTPYFERNRVKLNVYVAASRSVFEIFADHSTFLEGNYRPFNQVEVEYVGVIDRLGSPLNWGRDGTPSLDADFRTVVDAVARSFADAGISLTPSRRRKYDWAVDEVFRPTDRPPVAPEATASSSSRWGDEPITNR